MQSTKGVGVGCVYGGNGNMVGWWAEECGLTTLGLESARSGEPVRTEQ